MLGRTRLSPFERVAHDALHPVGRVDADLGGDLVGGARADRSPVAAVQALGALSHHDEVDLAGVGQRGGHARVVGGGAQVDVVVQGEAQAQQQAALQDAGGDGGVADGAQKDGVVVLDGLQVGIGEGLAGAVPAVGSQVEVGGGDLDAGSLQGGGQDLEPLGHDLPADAVPGDHCELDGLLLRHAPRVRRRTGTRDSGSAYRLREGAVDGGPKAGPAAGRGRPRDREEPRSPRTALRPPSDHRGYDAPALSCLLRFGVLRNYGCCNPRIRRLTPESLPSSPPTRGFPWTSRSWTSTAPTRRRSSHRARSSAARRRQSLRPPGPPGAPGELRASRRRPWPNPVSGHRGTAIQIPLAHHARRSEPGRARALPPP